MGNIVGVVIVIYLGGFGVFFWMWLIVLFGMVIKYVEGLFVIKFCGCDCFGFVVGGLMYYIEMGMGKKWKWFVKVFVFFGVLVVLFGIGIFL